MDLSIIIPFYNEEGNIPFVLDEVLNVCPSMRRSFEIIAVDDGSTDQTPGILRDFAADHKELKIIRHPSNLGQGAAFWTGFKNASGEIIITLDGDGQNDFHDVPRMLELLKDHDAVFGQRKNRKDPVSKLIATRIAYGARRLLLDDRCRDTACALKVMKREALACLIPVKGFLRFIPFLFEQAGIPWIAVDVNHRPRTKGESKYRLRKFFFLATISDLLFMRWYAKNCLVPYNNDLTHR